MLRNASMLRPGLLVLEQGVDLLLLLLVQVHLLRELLLLLRHLALQVLVVLPVDARLASKAYLGTSQHQAESKTSLNKSRYRYRPTLRFTVTRSTVFSSFGAKVLKNHRNLEWCKGKNVMIEKR